MYVVFADLYYYVGGVYGFMIWGAFETITEAYDFTTLLDNECTGASHYTIYVRDRA